MFVQNILAQVVHKTHLILQHHLITWYHCSAILVQLVVPTLSWESMGLHMFHVTWEVQWNFTGPKRHHRSHGTSQAPWDLRCPTGLQRSNGTWEVINRHAHTRFQKKGKSRKGLLSAKGLGPSEVTQRSLSDHSVGTQWSLSGHSVVTQCSLSGHSVVTQWSLSGHSVVTQRSLSGHSVVTQSHSAVTVTHGEGPPEQSEAGGGVLLLVTHLTVGIHLSRLWFLSSLQFEDIGQDVRTTRLSLTGLPHRLLFKLSVLYRQVIFHYEVPHLLFFLLLSFFRLLREPKVDTWRNELLMILLNTRENASVANH